MKHFKTLISFLVILLCSCQPQIKFDKVKWQTTDDPAFPPECRNSMLKDLLSNYNISKMNYSQVINLLGKPNINDTDSIAYFIITDYGRHIDPVYIKTLDIGFNKEHFVKTIRVSEWKK